MITTAKTLGERPWTSYALCSRAKLAFAPLFGSKSRNRHSVVAAQALVPPLALSPLRPHHPALSQVNRHFAWRLMGGGEQEARNDSPIMAAVRPNTECGRIKRMLDRGLLQLDSCHLQYASLGRHGLPRIRLFIANKVFSDPQTSVGGIPSSKGHKSNEPQYFKTKWAYGAWPSNSRILDHMARIFRWQPYDLRFAKTATRYLPID